MKEQRLYKFDNYVLDPEVRLLTDIEGNSIDVTLKAVEILCVLIEQAGTLVSKEKLFILRSAMCT